MVLLLPTKDWNAVPRLIQMLVWIPKKDDPETPEDMRPLALPTTFFRILFAVLAKRADKFLCTLLDPAQALVSKDKDAHMNHEIIQYFLSTGKVLDGHNDSPPVKALRTLLQVDLNKAFERIAPQWVLLVLSTLYVPYWFFSAVAFFLTGRKSRYWPL